MEAAKARITVLIVEDEPLSSFLPRPCMAHSLVRAVNDLVQRNFTPRGHAAG
jgi:hypothetical protein